MILLNKKLLILFVLLVISCSTIPKDDEEYVEYLDSQIGLSKVDLISEWGIPTEIKKQNDNTEILTYIRNYGVKEDIVDVSINGKKVDFGENNKVELVCVVDFIIDNGRVIKYSNSGNSCVENDLKLFPLLQANHKVYLDYYVKKIK